MASSRKAKKRVAVIGYGSQGRAIALNLRDSGYDVLLGLRAGSPSRKKAGRDRFTHIATPGPAAAQSDIIIMAIPDHEHGRLFARQIAPSIKRHATIVFLHGLSVHFGLVIPPKQCDIILIAPHSPGVALREQYLGERSVSGFIAVAQNPSGKARITARELAEAVGIARKRQISTTFAHEAIGDIFGEQAVLCGGLAMLIKHGFDTLVEAGLKPDHAYLEVAYQLDLIIKLIKKYGVRGMFERISVAAQFGSLCAGPRIIDQAVRDRMQRELIGIRTGQFARKLASLTPKQIASLNGALAALSSPAFEKAARRFSSTR
ncbi:MAG: ketol-acid reductoisomerase [candidate division Zixibacteria bacterium]|nr:ketol-acid reductoisomerase [candidate division Zixibacteria bacterium]